jgi:hypothetical protein
VHWISRPAGLTRHAKLRSDNIRRENTSHDTWWGGAWGERVEGGGGRAQGVGEP